jgi:hypothetical protein
MQLEESSRIDRSRECKVGVGEIVDLVVIDDRGSLVVCR